MVQVGGINSMPIKPNSIPKVLPAGAKAIFRGAFNSAYNKCKSGGGSTKTCDSRAARIAWSAVKRVYKKGKDGKWVLKKKSKSSASI